MKGIIAIILGIILMRKHGIVEMFITSIFIYFFINIIF